MSVPVLHATEPHGTGPLLLLGPSLGTSTILWEDTLSLLREHFTVVAWDLPGHGLSPATTEPFTVEELADAVVAIADELGHREFFYAGDSLSGGVGIAVMQGHPHRAIGAAIICSTAKFGTSEGWHERAALARTTGTASLVVPSAQRWFAPDSIARRPVLSGRLLNALREVDDESYALCCEALAAYDGRPGLGDIATPVDVIVGQYDIAVPHESSRAVANGIPGAKWIEIPDAAHLVPAEQPELCARELIAFFKGANR